MSINKISDIRPQKIGIYGGAFDPVHNTHLLLAQAVYEFLNLDHLIWVPTGDAWHKSRTLSQADHRMNMLKLAIDGTSGQNWSVNACEINREIASYTIDTLLELQHGSAPNTQWYLLLGMDQFINFHAWNHWQEIAKRCTLAIVGRKGVEMGAPLQVLKTVQWVSIPFESTDVSSTQIRGLVQCMVKGNVQAKEQLQTLLPQSVIHYIEHHHLYQ